ncbi:MAG: ATP-binding protein [Gemmatimonadales bacterium]
MERLKQLPLFYKILLANTAIVVAGAAAGTVLTAELVRAVPDRPIAPFVLLFIATGAVVSAFVNAVILRLALAPVRTLEQTAEAVGAGDLGARAIESPFGDAQLNRLTRIFNETLENLTTYRRQLTEAAARAQNAQEEERKRIARELHDETAQTLAALVIRLRVARDTVDPADREARLDEVRDEIAGAVDGIRRFARGLRPPALSQIGVAAAISEYVRSLCETTELDCDFDADPIEGLLHPNAELAVYRIVQEALSNTIRHAGASSVRVAVRREAESVVVTVADDGKGFPANSRSDSVGGLGIFGMRERAAYIGGTVTIDGDSGNGTTVRVEVPVLAAVNK